MRTAKMPFSFNPYQMKFQLFFFSITFLFFSNLFSQNTFEILIPWENDTCVMGHFARETPEGDFVILSTNAYFDSDPGFPLEGTLVYGTGLSKISSSGEMLWKKLYPTCFDPYQTNAFPYGIGRIPARDFLINSNNQIIIPYTFFTGLDPCDSLTSHTEAYSLKHSLIKINSETGEIINNRIFEEDALCSMEKIRSTALVNDEIKMLFFEERYKNTFIETIDEESFDLLQKDTIGSGNIGYYFEYDNFTNAFVKILQSGLSFYDLNGNLFQEFVRENESEDILLWPTRKFSTNGEYYVGMCSGTENDYATKASVVFVFNSSGTLVSQKYFQHETFFDVAINSSNDILLLSSENQDLFTDTITKSVNVWKFDIDLNLISSKEYGFPFIIPSQIGVASNDRFFVTGIRLKSMDLYNGKEPDQIYFLLDSIENLISDVDENTTENTRAKIFPNPFSIKLILKTEGFDNSYQFKLFDLSGKKIFDEIIQDEEIKNVNSLPSGIYFYQIFDAESRFFKSGKLVKM